MNIFILNSGRCGSTTFIKACRHITNFTATHEANIAVPGHARLEYPQNHIEADNRLTWFLGRLEQRFGDSAFYVHLQRERQATIDSFVRRMDFGIMQAYRQGIYLHAEDADPQTLAGDYVDTVNANISCFLKDKSRRMTVQLENAQSDFTDFWNAIDAQGDLQHALQEWTVSYNHS